MDDKELSMLKKRFEEFTQSGCESKSTIDIPRFSNDKTLHITTSKALDEECDRFRIFKCDSKIAYPHFHDFLELAYVEKGSAEHFCGGRTETITEGDYFIIDFGVNHGYIATSPDLILINCLFMPSFIDKTLVNCMSFNNVLSNYLIRFGEKSHITKIGDCIFNDENSTVQQLLYLMIAEYNAKESGYLEMLRCRLIEVIISTMRKASVNGSKSESCVCGDSVSQIKKYVDENYMRRITLSQISDDLNYSLPYICKKFRTETGMLFTDYLQKVRIEQSCRLIANTDKKIIDIAQLVGYDDVKFFGTVFRKYMDMTPRAYRKIVCG